MGKLEDRVAIITGAAGGIGGAIARAFIEEGARVIVADRDEAAARRAADLLGDDAAPFAVDVTREADVRTLVAATLERFGRIDILVNNAGIIRKAFVKDMTEETWDAVLDVNLKATFLCSKAVLPALIEGNRGGRIINIASIAGKGYAGTSNAAYAASKGAVISLTRTAAQQLGPHNINVNSVCPGVTRTALGMANLAVRARQEGVTEEEMARRQVEGIPIRRANDPEDIAAMAVFLASPGARNITGQNYNVDGGIIPE